MGTGGSNEALLYNNFNKFKAYKLAGGKNFHVMTITQIEAEAASSETKLKFDDKTSYWLWMTQDAVGYKDIVISKNYLVKSKEKDALS